MNLPSGKQKTVKEELRHVRNTQVIQDPFPEQSAYQKALSDISGFAQLLPVHIPAPPQISLWAAYRKGYEQAYAEIEKAIGEKRIL